MKTSAAIVRKVLNRIARLHDKGFGDDSDEKKGAGDGKRPNHAARGAPPGDLVVEHRAQHQQATEYRQYFQQKHACITSSIRRVATIG